METKQFLEEKGIQQILSAAIILSVGFFIIWPLWNKTKETYNNLQKIKTVEEKINKNIQNLTKQKSLLKEYALEISAIPKAITPKANEDQFINIAQYASGKNKISISKIDFAYTDNEVNFDMAVEGSYPNISKFVEMLNIAPRIIHLKTLTLVKSKEDSFNGLVIASIKGKFFILPKQ
jgi:Tfp pilus assembly protein PilO